MAGGKSKPKGKNQIGDWPQITENHWYALAITTAVLTAVAIVFAFGAIFIDGFDGDSDAKLAQALAPFGVALFAMVTFCTVAWRGSVNVRQADQAEREGRAKLLQEGAKLLGESNNQSHVSAGIATLEILISGPDEKMAVQAMNLIADYVQREMAHDHDHYFQKEAFAALAVGERYGRIAQRSLKFSDEISGVLSNEWKSLLGVQEVKYVGGKIESGFVGDFKDSNRYRYEGVEILFMDDVEVSSRYRNCMFEYCDIKKIIGRSIGAKSENKFKECDFSDCEFSRFEKIPDFRGGLNYYRGSRSPSVIDGEEPHWPDVLILDGHKKKK